MKKLAFLLVLVLALGFTVESTAQDFLVGKYDANQSSSGYILHKNEGDRVYTKYIKFEKAFETVPEILVTVNKVESHKDANVRFNAQAEGVSRDGFTLKVSTWNDTRLLAIGGNWVAFVK